MHHLSATAVPLSSIACHWLQVSAMAEKVLATPPKPSFAKLHPEFEGCCMGNRQTCKCGAPFFS